MNPVDHPAGESTGVGRVQDPAASALAPVAPRRGARRTQDPGSAGRAAPVPTAGAAPETPCPAHPPVPGQAPMSPPQPAAVAGTPTPETGAAAPGIKPAAPVRGRAQSPAGGELDADGSPSAGSSGAEWRKKVKAATSALHAEQRRGAHRYTKVADRTAGSQFKPGMARREPPASDEPDGAA